MKASDYYAVGDFVVFTSRSRVMQPYKGRVTQVIGFKTNNYATEVLLLAEPVRPGKGVHPAYVQLCNVAGRRLDPKHTANKVWN